MNCKRRTMNPGRPVAEAVAVLQENQSRFNHRASVAHCSLRNPIRGHHLNALGGIASVNKNFNHYSMED